MDLQPKTAAHPPSMCNLEFATNRRGTKILQISLFTFVTATTKEKLRLCWFGEGGHCRRWIWCMWASRRLCRSYRFAPFKPLPPSDLLSPLYDSDQLLSGVYYKLRPYGKYFVEHKLRQSKTILMSRPCWVRQLLPHSLKLLKSSRASLTLVFGSLMTATLSAVYSRLRLWLHAAKQPKASMLYP
jgi:hypothetical protein